MSKNKIQKVLDKYIDIRKHAIEIGRPLVQISIKIEKIKNCFYCHIITDSGYTIFRCHLSEFPSCCGTHIFHNFSYINILPSLSLPYDGIKEILDIFFNMAVETVPYFDGNKRVQLIMAELSRAPFPNHFKSSDEIPKVKDVRIEYPHFYNYFKSSLKFSERLMYNNNSGRVLYDIEAVLE